MTTGTLEAPTHTGALVTGNTEVLPPQDDADFEDGNPSEAKRRGRKPKEDMFLFRTDRYEVFRSENCYTLQENGKPYSARYMYDLAEVCKRLVELEAGHSGAQTAEDLIAAIQLSTEQVVAAIRGIGK